MSQARFLVADVFEGLASLPDNSVDLILASPPFLALRSYLPSDHPDKGKEIGGDATPGAFIDSLLDVTEACARVLAPHGSLCIELGDTYSGSGGAGGDYAEGGMRDGQPVFDGSQSRARPGSGISGPTGLRDRPIDVAAGLIQDRQRPFTLEGQDSIPGWPLAKSLSLIPESYRWALVYGRNPFSVCSRCEGTGSVLANAFVGGNVVCPKCLGARCRTTERWRARNVIRWCRPNPPVGQLADKVRPATSDIIVACKSRSRYFDLDAVRHVPLNGLSPDQHTGNGLYRGHPREDPSAGRPNRVSNPAGAPPLDHWWFDEDVFDQDAFLVSTIPYKGAHYATWPSALLVTPIEAMCPQKVCRTCGEPSRRIVDAQRTLDGEPRDDLGSISTTGRGSADADGIGHWRKGTTYTTLGWTDCGCSDDGSHWRNGIVLDCFAGSGTTGMVATGLGRDAVLIDIDERNAELARQRVGMFLTVEELEKT